MKIMAGVTRICLFAAIISITSNGSSQEYPSKPIRIIAAGPGGGTDFTARVIAQGISSQLGQVIVENRPSGPIPNETVAKAAPDGYTLLTTPSGLWIGPFLQKVPYDPVRDFAPITLVFKAPSVLVVNRYLPVKSVKELIALAKAKPGELNYSSGGTGGTSHLAPELFKSMAGVDIVRVAYRNGALETADLISGQVQLTFGSAASLMPYVHAGRLRALAVASLEPSELVPGLPTIAATLPGFETGTTMGIFAPAKTPEAIIKRLNQEIVRFLNTKEAKQRFFEAGAAVVVSSPQELAAIIQSDLAKWGKLIKDAGIRAD